jgi:anti-anti-sigma factor
MDPSERLELEPDDVGGVSVVRLEGEVDKLALDQARARLDSLAAAGRLVIDLDRVSFIDSAGLHALFGLGRVASAAGGGVALAVPPSCAVARVVDIVRLADAMPVRESVEDAAAALGEVSQNDTQG